MGSSPQQPLCQLATVLSFSNHFFLTTTLSFLSFRAYPDFLLHRSDNDHLCGSP
jgi:hypothetical protein